MRGLIYTLVITLFFALTLAESSAAQGRRDGPSQVRPMNEILSMVQSRYPGRVIDVDLVGGRTYRVKLVTRSGEIMVVSVDGRSGRVLGVRGGRR